MRILGLSAFYHDSAAALVEDGKVRSAAQEERFTRKKHDAGFPKHAVDYCLNEAGIGLGDVDFVAFYDKPFLKFERLMETYLSFAPRGFRSFSMAMPLWLKEKLFQKSLIKKELKSQAPSFDWEKQLLFAEHHQSHAASAFFPSPFREALVLTMDGVGEWATTSVGHGVDDRLEMMREIHFPHSLGLLYSAFTYYTGFKVNSGEYKLMGLAPYGEPQFVSLIRDNLIDIKPDGTFRLDLRYFDYCTGLRMTNERFDALFDGPPRDPHRQVTQREMDIAASIQAVTEEVVMRLCRSLGAEGRSRNLCLAGGVALNCVANGKALKAGPFENIWVQPAAGDAGGAVGAALAAYHQHLAQPRLLNGVRDGMQGSYLGPSFAQDEIEQRLSASGANYSVAADHELIDSTARAIANGKALGWFQGRMEFGPRALGSRSILADPRSSNTQSTLNQKVKFRESFRPFAPSVLIEHASDWFDLDVESPYMMMVADVLPKRRRPIANGEAALSGLARLKVARSEIPAVTHVDYSARIQTVHPDTNPRYHALISRFHQITGCPVVVNTSFNVRGEPIVCTPEDAFRCFMGTDLDMLAVGNCVLNKSEQSSEMRQRHETHKDSFELD